MISCTHRWIRFAVATALLTPSIASAQDVTLAALPADRGSAMAAELEARAADLSSGPRWASAETLYRDAAGLRGAGDAARANNLRLAGYINYYDGKLAEAVAALTDAAEAFLTIGDVLRGAETLTESAWVAAERGSTGEAHALRNRAVLLSRSPLLTAEDRANLLRRLGVVAS